MPIQLVPQKGGGRRKQTLQFCLFSLIVAFLVFRQLSMSAKSIESNIVVDDPLDAAEGFDSPAFGATLGNIITPARSVLPLAVTLPRLLLAVTGLVVAKNLHQVGIDIYNMSKNTSKQSRMIWLRNLSGFENISFGIMKCEKNSLTARY